jgi:hypothetical protein
MQKVPVNAELPQKLLRLMHPAELIDDNGEVVGMFQPNLSRYQGLEPQVSEEELDRREQEGGGRTLAEILRDLGLRS